MQGILDYRESKPEAGEVSLIGRVGLEKLKWSNQSAMFVITDPSEALEGAGHHECTDDNCPFCKAKGGGHPSRAIVMLIGDNGQVPAIPARKLLPLEEGQTVVVSGRAEINEQGDLVVHAKGAVRAAVRVGFRGESRLTAEWRTEPTLHRT